MKKIQKLYITLAFMVSFSCAAQSVPSNAKEILTSKEWKLDDNGFNSPIVCTLKFTNTTLITHRDGKLIGEQEYYFSTTLNDCSPNGFDENNVGNSSIGRYLIFENSCLELINVTPDQLRYKPVRTGSPRYKAYETTASPL